MVCLLRMGISEFCMWPCLVIDYTLSFNSEYSTLNLCFILVNCSVEWEKIMAECLQCF